MGREIRCRKVVDDKLEVGRPASESSKRTRAGDAGGWGREREREGSERQVSRCLEKRRDEAQHPSSPSFSSHRPSRLPTLLLSFEGFSYISL